MCQLVFRENFPPKKKNGREFYDSKQKQHSVGPQNKNSWKDLDFFQTRTTSRFRGMSLNVQEILVSLKPVILDKAYGLTKKILRLDE